MVFLGRLEVTSLALAALAAGTVLGVWLFRFGARHAWMTLVCLVGALVVCVILLANVEAFGSAGVAWMGALVGGSNIGVAWRTAAQRRKAPVKKAAWQVDGRGFGAVAEARLAAGTALRALDGKSRCRLAVARGPARLEVAGGPETGFVCHRSRDAADERSWAVLTRQEQLRDETVEVPMGKIVGHIPVKLVHDFDSASAALGDFLRNPGAAELGPEWVTGVEAEGTRLAVK
ncbi:hypothetical protein KKR91_01885 [Arthrobacter jiangjiafuii]|uniref:Uncharacterized protein n=2 Tax=Arthrobacter jiangjiafuii TaxID=2817475 RepID=A0A975M8E2_9MICC|nr:hypothetical protein [Arthrobacter jiangjiafuii]QWC11589.1 hypothetical protein KKR91_01885 [Arthrobacter jiangjiafuii]